MRAQHRRLLPPQQPGQDSRAAMRQPMVERRRHADQGARQDIRNNHIEMRTARRKGTAVAVTLDGANPAATSDLAIRLAI